MPAVSTTNSASTIAPFSGVILSFFSGVFVPVDQLPNWAEQIGKIFPLYHLAAGLQTTLVSGAPHSGLNGDDVAVLGAWMLVGLVIAVRRFRWEPQGAN